MSKKIIEALSNSYKASNMSGLFYLRRLSQPHMPGKIDFLSYSFHLHSFGVMLNAE